MEHTAAPRYSVKTVHLWLPALRRLILGMAMLGSLALFQAGARADDDTPPPPPPPPPGDTDTSSDDQAAPPEGGAIEVEPLNPGEAVITRFSHVIEQLDSEGAPVKVIDVNGTSASIIDIRRPGVPAQGQHWINEPQRMFVLAGEVGQVFGVELGDLGGPSPDIFLSASAAFGLHHEKAGTEWVAGMWGPDAGPGTIYRIGDSTGYVATKFADVTLDGRLNTGAALGNIAFDRWHKRLFATDLETGMIHAFDAETGRDLGHFDHGIKGRSRFLDAWKGVQAALDTVSFDPSSKAQTDSCPGDFSKTPECWNIADFRRRVWGIGVRRGEGGEVRLYYAVWGSEAFGNSEWASAGDDRRNAVWSVGIPDSGGFDTSSIRREFFLPAFWPNSPDMGAKAGNSNPVSDITFPECGPQNVMILSERGGMRNLGLDKVEPFARPHESRVMRYELGSDNIWRPKGRYDVGFYDRRREDGPPFIFANAAGGADFGFGFDENGFIDTSARDKSLWMTGDSLCSPEGACTSMASGEHDDTSEVHGLQGSPDGMMKPVGPGGEPLEQTVSASRPDFGALDHSYMIDTDIDVDGSGAPIPEEMSRNDATKIGDVAIYQLCENAPPLPLIEVPDEVFVPDEPPDWPVHTVNMSHDKWASTAHGVNRSWHQRNASWHAVDRSWHWRNQSWHSRNQSWHWREGSWHNKQMSWHRKGYSLHSKQYSWHYRDKSWHARDRSYHSKDRSWGDQHVKNRTYHNKNKTWGGDQPNHVKNRTYHNKNKTWGGDQPNHVKDRTYHKKNQTWGGGGDQPNHVKDRTYHKKNQTWGGGGGGDQPNHVKGKSDHTKGKTFGGGGGGGGDQPNHVKGRTHQKNQTWGGGDTHKKEKSQTDQGGGDTHTKDKSRADQGGGDTHKKDKSRADQGGGGDTHKKDRSQADQGGGGDTHKKDRSQADQGGGGDTHKKNKSQADQGGGGEQPPKKKRHVKGQSFHDKPTSNFVESQ